jgi:hypothetical protein
MQRQPLHRTLSLSFAGTGSGGLRDTTRTALVGVGTGSPGGENVVRLDLKSLQRPMRLGLLPGGGFETPEALGRSKARALYARNPELGAWRITAGSANVQRDWPVAGGRQTLDLNGVTPGTIEQTFATIPGQVYQLLFDYANNPDARGRTATATVTLSGVGTLLSREIAHAGSTPRAMKYTRFRGAFIADSATTAPRFASSTPGAFGIILDAVSVMAVPGSQ